MPGTFGGIQVKWDPAKLAEVLRSEQGPVFKDLLVRADKVKARAQELCPVYKGDTTFRSRSPGTLRDSIVKRVVAGDGGLPVVQVGTDDPVGLYVHEGTVPHKITGNPRLVFNWPKAGGVVSFPSVNHPGTKPNPFLTKALDVLSG